MNVQQLNQLPLNQLCRRHLVRLQKEGQVHEDDRLAPQYLASLLLARAVLHNHPWDHKRDLKGVYQVLDDRLDRLLAWDPEQAQGWLLPVADEFHLPSLAKEVYQEFKDQPVEDLALQLWGSVLEHEQEVRPGLAL